jgi:DNA-directed RNA polymerase specialized sigma subunit
MTSITETVLNYRKTKKDVDFQPIWNHFEPKIKAMAHLKSQRLPVDYCTLYEYMVDGLLLAIERFDEKKSEFNTYFYQRVNGKISGLITKLNRIKRKVNLRTEPLTTISDSGQELELQIADPKASIQVDNPHVIFATRTIDTILGEC